MSGTSNHLIQRGTQNKEKVKSQKMKAGNNSLDDNKGSDRCLHGCSDGQNV